MFVSVSKEKKKVTEYDLCASNSTMKIVYTHTHTKTWCIKVI